MSKSPSLRRIQADIRELALDPSDRYTAAPLDSDMFEWHFTIRGPPDSDFAGGIYHGRILLPPEYPFKPPHIIFLTKTGRFETNTKVCLSFSAFHPELWQPAWGIRLILEALISFLPTPADGALGAIDWSSSERQHLAKASVQYFCPVCQKRCAEMLPLECKTATTASEEGSKTKSKFQKEIEKLQQLQMQQHPKDEAEAAAAKATEPTSSAQSKSAENEDQSKATPDTSKDTENMETDPLLQKHESASTKGNLSATEEQVGAQSSATAVEETTAAVVAPRDLPIARAQDATVVQHGERVGNNTSTASTSSTGAGLDLALQVAIVLLSILAYTLLRKIHALLQDLNALRDT